MNYAERTRLRRLLAASKPARITPGFALVDAQARNRQHPDSFPLPFAHEIAGLAPGDYAKVGVERGGEHGCGEIFWVYIAERKGDRFRGFVSNTLVLGDEHGLQLGTLVAFEARHVRDVDGVDAGAEEEPADNISAVCPCCNGLNRRGAMH